MQNVTARTTLTINLTPDQWELYSDKPGSDVAAKEINRQIQSALNTAHNAQEAESKAVAVLRRYSEFGAMDSEPIWVMKDLLDMVFPKEGARIPSMENVTAHTALTLNLTAAQWDLYTSMPDVEEVARKLNRQVQSVINVARNSDDAIRQVEDILGKYATYGAADTEPRQIACDLVKMAFAHEKKPSSSIRP